MAPIYNVSKIQNILGDIPDIPDTYTQKHKKPKELAIVSNSCTGCQVCIPFCPVDCIEPLPAGTYKDTVVQPVQVRLDECIGCTICVRVCTKLAWDAIRMEPTAQVEAQGIEITNTYNPQPVISLKDLIKDAV